MTHVPYINGQTITTKDYIIIDESMEIDLSALWNSLDTITVNPKVKTMQFYNNPFHATEEPVVAEELTKKADLAIMIRDSMHYNGDSLEKVTNTLSLSKAQLSDILLGKLDEFTVSELEAIQSKLNNKQI